MALSRLVSALRRAVQSAGGGGPLHRWEQLRSYGQAVDMHAATFTGTRHDRPLAEHLGLVTRVDYAVRAPEVPGHGRSWEPEGTPERPLKAATRARILVAVWSKRPGSPGPFATFGVCAPVSGGEVRVPTYPPLSHGNQPPATGGGPALARERRAHRRSRRTRRALRPRRCTCAPAGFEAPRRLAPRQEHAVMNEARAPESLRHDLSRMLGP
jgi:hypothetical protein